MILQQLSQNELFRRFVQRCFTKAVVAWFKAGGSKEPAMIRLDPFTPTHFDELLAWISNETELMQFAGPDFTFPLTKEQLVQSLRDTNRLSFRVVDTSSEVAIGHAEIYLAERCAYLGKILIGDNRLRGRGIGQQIVRQLLQIAFENLSRSCVELNVFDWNRSAIHCYKRVGFVFGNKRAERIVNGQTWTALNMVIEKPFQSG